MKRVLFVVFLFITSLLRADEKASVVIKMSPDKAFVYWFSGKDYLSDYEQSFARGEKAKTDSNGYYRNEFDISKPLTLNLGKVNKTIMTVLPLYLTPGSRDTITFEKDTITFQGTNADYNRCLQETESFLNNCNQFLIGRPNKDPLFQTKSYAEFTRLLKERKAETEKTIKQYSDLPIIFLDEQLAHIDLGSRMAFMYKVLFNVPDSLQTDDWKEASRQMVDQPIRTPYFTSFRETYFLLSGLLGLACKVETGSIKGKNVSLESFERLPRHLEGKNLECAWATLINNDIVYGTYDPIVPELYEMLKKRFPENNYKAFLETGIAKNERFNAINSADNSDKDYQIMVCDTSFHSLSDVVKSLKGKPVYVDLWATWCTSCLSEFPYLRQVEPKVKDLDVTFLYVSMDRPENKKRWEKSLRYYKLKGYHLLATPELAKAIYKEFGNYIPHAILFDKNGNIVERNAPGLKQVENLYEKLVKWSK